MTTDEGTVLVSRPVLAVDLRADAFTALEVMRRNRVRHLPVVDGRTCVGLLTEADVLAALADALPHSAGSLCHSPPPTVPAGAPLGRVAAQIMAGGLDAALVIRDSVLIGIVTCVDVLEQVAQNENSS